MKLHALAIILLSMGCLAKRAGKIARSTASPTKVTATTYVPESYFLTEETTTEIDAKSLRIYRATVGTLTISKTSVPLVSFAADGQADMVVWEACPTHRAQISHPLADLSCVKGQTVLNELTLGQLQSLSYDIGLKACLYLKEGATDDGSNCGTETIVTWEFPEGVDLKSDLQASELFKLSEELRSYGSDLYELLDRFMKETLKCIKDKKILPTDILRRREILRDDIYYQIANIQRLGPVALGDALTLQPGGTSEDLAKIVDDTQNSSETGDPDYQPEGGLHLTESKSLGKNLNEFLRGLSGRKNGFATGANFKNSMLGASGFVKGMSGQTASLSESVDPTCAKLSAQVLATLTSAQKLDLALCQVLLESPELSPAEAMQTGLYLLVQATLQRDVEAPSEGQAVCASYSYINREKEALLRHIETLQERIADLSKS